MKAIAKTTSPINLIDPMTRDLLEETPHVVTWTQFKEARTGAAQIKVLASDLPDEADDEEFQEFLAEAKDEDHAVGTYIAKFNLVEDDDDDDIVTREKLETKAGELGVKFRKDISDEKLREKVIEAEVAAEVAAQAIAETEAEIAAAAASSEE